MYQVHSQHGAVSLAVVQKLLETGHDLHSCDTSGLNVILKVAHCGGRFPNVPVLEFLLEREDISRIDKIDALEMAGSVLLAHDENHEQFPLAFQYWRRALILRLLDTENCRPIHKTPLKSKSGQLSEWSTLEDLQRIEQQPAQRKIQALLVQLRIFSSLGWPAVDKHLSSIFVFVTMEPLRQPTINQILDFSWIILDTILRSVRPHERMLGSKAGAFVGVLVYSIMHLPKGHPIILNSENLKNLLELVLMVNPFHLIDIRLEAVTSSAHMHNLCRMIMMISQHPELVTEEIRLTLIQLVHRDGRDQFGFNLLHTVCCNREFISPPTISFLIKLGADLNARNNVGDGVLHILAQEPASETRYATAQLLVDLGAHLDMVNKDGMTAADLWFKKNTPEKKDVADLPDWLQEGVPKLMCLSSRVIRRHKLPYDDGAIVPVVLIPFVSLH